MKKNRYVLTLFIVFLMLGLAQSSNYGFQVVATNEVPLGPVEFESFALSADTYQYIDATQVETYGTVAADPPLGMGVDDTTTTNMTEGSYTGDDTYTQLEYSAFGSLPTGWYEEGFTVSGGIATSDIVSTRFMQTKTYDLSSYDGARLTYWHRAFDFENYLYEAVDWDIYAWLTGDGASHVANIAAADPSGAWKTGDHSMVSTYSSFKVIIINDDAATNEQIQTDNWYIYAITENTYYRFEAVFRFDSVTTALVSYTLYIDFYSALTGSDSLNFYIGTTTNPSGSAGSSKQDDFSVDVSDYITGSTIYLKIADTNYRSGDTVQTTAYIQRCYLYSPAEAVNWYDSDWSYRKQISIVEQSGAGTNYQIPITGYYNNSAKDVAGSVDFEALCQTDFDDIRFTASNGTTLLDYFIDPVLFVSGTSARFWVEVKADVSTTASDVKIFVYFGNDAVSDMSSGYNTFIIFDNFDDTTVNTSVWDHTSGTIPTEAGGYLVLTGVAGGGALMSDTEAAIGFEYNISAYASHTYTYSGRHISMIDADHSSSDYINGYDTATANTWTIGTVNDGAASSSNILFSAQTSERVYSIRGTSTSFKWYEGSGTLKHTSTTNIPTENLGVWYTRATTNTRTWYINCSIVRKYVATEPTFAVPGGLEYQDLYAPVMNAASYSPINPTTNSGITLFAIVTDADSVAMHEVYFNAIAYPAGFSDIDYNATESGENVWTYTFAADELDAGVYCFVAHARDTVHETDASYSMYQTFQITQSADTQLTCYIVVFDTLGDFIPFETFEVYRNGARQYTYTFVCYDYEPQNITVVDRWGETLNSTEFEAGTVELVVTVNIYSLKVQSWYEDYVFFNLTRSSITYREVIAPLEIVNFRLYENTYNWTVDYRNTTTISGETELNASTCIVITGNTIADVAGLSQSLLDMTTAINVTVTATNNYVLTISIDLDNVNTTINNQLIQVLLDISNTNSTVYSQTVDLLALIQNVNVTLFDQTVSVLASISNLDSDIAAQTVTILASIEDMNSTLYAQTLTLLSTITNTNTTIMAQTVTMLADIATLYSTTISQALNILLNITNVNSTIYAQTVSILSAISNLDSDIAGQTVTLLASISNVNSTLYSQTVTLLANIANLDSDIVAQTVTLLASITNVNSTIYAQTVDILADVSNVNSTLYTQTVTLIANVANIDADIAAQTITLLASISNVNTTIYAQTVDILADVSNVNSTLYSQTLTVLTNIANMNLTLYTQAVDIMADIANTNTTIYSQLLTEMLVVDNINATIYSQVITQLLAIYNKPDNAGGDNDVVELAILNIVSYGILGLFGFMFLMDIPAVQEALPGGGRRKATKRQQSPGEYPSGNGDRSSSTTGARSASTREPWDFGDDRRKR